MAAAEAAAPADRRGASVVVRAAADGPVAAAAGGALLEPHGLGAEALAAAGPADRCSLTVAAAAGLCPTPDSAAAADQLDAMALACHPSSDFFVNPALTLAEHLTGGTPLFDRHRPDRRRARRARLPLAGRHWPARPGSWLTAAAGRRVAAGVRPDRRRPPTPTLFYDPYDDEPATAPADPRRCSSTGSVRAGAPARSRRRGCRRLLPSGRLHVAGRAARRQTAAGGRRGRRVPRSQAPRPGRPARPPDPETRTSAGHVSPIDRATPSPGLLAQAHAGSTSPRCTWVCSTGARPPTGQPRAVWAGRTGSTAHLPSTGRPRRPGDADEAADPSGPQRGESGSWS